MCIYVCPLECARVAFFVQFWKFPQKSNYVDIPAECLWLAFLAIGSRRKQCKQSLIFARWPRAVYAIQAGRPVGPSAPGRLQASAPQGCLLCRRSLPSPALPSSWHCPLTTLTSLLLWLHRSCKALIITNQTSKEGIAGRGMEGRVGGWVRGGPGLLIKDN